MDKRPAAQQLQGGTDINTELEQMAQRKPFLEQEIGQAGQILHFKEDIIAGPILQRDDLVIFVGYDIGVSPEGVENIDLLLDLV